MPWEGAFPADPPNPTTERLTHRLFGGVQSRTHLLQQFLAAVGFWNESAQALSEHRSDFRLLCEPAAENHVYFRIHRAQFLEHRIAVNDRQKVIENHQPNL